MNYTFKLSRRMAVARFVPVAALVFGTACDTVDSLGAAESGAAELALSPARATAEPQQKIRLAFRDQVIGDLTPSFDVEWTVVGGSGVIAPDGSFTATQPGVYTIIGAKGKGNGGGNNGQGKGNGGSNTDTSVVVVVPPAPTLVAVELTPATASVEAGGHLQFDAVGRDPDGATVAIGVDWSATGGTIDAGGHYIAGSVGGTYRVVASHSGSGYADTATVSVTEAPVSPPPSSDPPAGDPSLTVISDRRFDAKVESGWGDRGDSYFSIATKPAQRSPDNVGQAFFPKGFPSGSGPIFTSLPVPGRRVIEMSFDVQLSSNWYGNDAGINKIFYIWIHGKPVVVLAAQGSGTNALRSQVRLQDMPSGARNLSPNLGTGSIDRGRWVRWDVRLVANTPGVANGEIHWSIDGEPAGSFTDIMFSGAEQSNTWERIVWNPTYGGAGNPVPYDQYMWMDHAYVAGQ